MPSYQQPVGSAKAEKFTVVNPLEPMVDPFPNAGLNDEQQSVQRVLAENVNARMEKAMTELQEKHRQGTQEKDDPNRAPTGEPYRRLQQQQQQAILRQKQQQTKQEQAANHKQEQPWIRPKEAHGDDQDEEEDDNSFLDDDNDDDDDPVLEAIRQRRLEELKQAQAKHLENLSKGHGQVRTIVQDEFLPECTGSSEWVAIHFFHEEFEKCRIMDHHLQKIAPLHTTCKFLRMDANKAPFFV